MTRSSEDLLREFEEVAEQETPGRLGFLDADEWLAQVPEAIPWVWSGYLARGAVTMLTGGRRNAGRARSCGRS